MIQIVVILGIFFSSCSQLLLKDSADRPHEGFLSSLLNWRVILAYMVISSCLVINVIAFKNGLNFKELPILESLGYVFVPVLSCLFLKEKIDSFEKTSLAFIIIGIIIFYA